MKIAILLPYKEDYTPKFSGAVSIHVSSLLNFSKFKSTTTIYGNTKSTNYLTRNFHNIRFNQTILSSNNKIYLNKFIDIIKSKNFDLIEIHNRPSYFKTIKKKLKSKIIIYLDQKLKMNVWIFLKNVILFFSIANGQKINFLMT